MNNLNNKISAGTIARTACLLLALTNQILSACGKPVLPIESATVEQLVTAGITTVTARADCLVEEQQLHHRRNPGGQVPGGQEEPDRQVSQPHYLAAPAAGRKAA